MEKSLALKEVVSTCSFYVDGEGTTEGLTDMSSNTGNCLIYVQIDITNCNLGHKMYEGKVSTLPRWTGSRCKVPTCQVV